MTLLEWIEQEQLDQFSQVCDIITWYTRDLIQDRTSFIYTSGRLEMEPKRAKLPHLQLAPSLLGWSQRASPKGRWIRDRNGPSPHISTDQCDQNNLIMFPCFFHTLSTLKNTEV